MGNHKSVKTCFYENGKKKSSNTGKKRCDRGQKERFALIRESEKTKKWSGTKNRRKDKEGRTNKKRRGLKTRRLGSKRFDRKTTKNKPLGGEKERTTLALVAARGTF